MAIFFVRPNLKENNYVCFIVGVWGQFFAFSLRFFTHCLITITIKCNNNISSVYFKKYRVFILSDINLIVVMRANIFMLWYALLTYRNLYVSFVRDCRDTYTKYIIYIYIYIYIIYYIYIYIYIYNIFRICVSTVSDETNV